MNLPGLSPAQDVIQMSVLPEPLSAVATPLNGSPEQEPSTPVVSTPALSPTPIDRQQPVNKLKRQLAMNLE